MEFQQIPGQPTCSSDSTSSAVAAPSTSTIPARLNPITEIRWGRRWEQVHDVDGSLWEVREARATKHGFDLLFGYFANPHLGGHATQGNCRLIATPALIDYWEQHRTEEHAIYDLPAGRFSLHGLRRKHGFNFFTDRRKIWKGRIDDLKTLSVHEFAKKYDVDFRVVQEWRLRLVGRIAKPADWAQDPAVLDILRAPLFLREIGEKLGISLHQARRLRQRALASPEAKFDAPWKRPLPPRWRNAESLAILRSDLKHLEAARKLGISITHTQTLRQMVKNDPSLAA